MRIFLHMDDSFELVQMFSGAVTARDSNGDTCSCLVDALPYTHCPISSPLHAVKVLHPALWPEGGESSGVRVGMRRGGVVEGPGGVYSVCAWS